MQDLLAICEHVGPSSLAQFEGERGRERAAAAVERDREGTKERAALPTTNLWIGELKKKKKKW